MADPVWRTISFTRVISFVVLVTIIVIIGILFYRVMANFLLPLFLAALLVVIFRPMHHWLLVRCGGRQRLAAGLTTAAILLIVLVPLGLVTFFAISEGASLATEVDVRMMRERFGKFRERLGLNSPYIEPLQRIDVGLYELEHNTALPIESQEILVERLLERVHQIEDQIEQGPAGQLVEDAHEDSTSPTAVKHEQDAATPTSAVEPALDEAARAFLDRYRELIAPLKDSLLAMQSAPLGSLDRERALTDAQLALRRVKQHLLGGPFHAWLKQMANPSEDELRQIRGLAFARVQGGIVAWSAATGAVSARFIIGLVIMIVALYFFLVDGPAMLTDLMRLSPLDDQYENELLTEFVKISRAVVVATLLSAVVQAFLAGVGFWAAGVHAVFLLSLLTGLFALIPFVGAATVWVPVVLWLFFYEERTTAAVILAIYGACIVSTSDNVVKAIVLHGQSRLHPLLALLSILGGVAAVGPIGILVGPMVVVFLQALLNILHRELASMDHTDAALSPAADSASGAASNGGSPPVPPRNPLAEDAAASSKDVQRNTTSPPAGATSKPSRRRKKR